MNRVLLRISAADKETLTLGLRATVALADGLSKPGGGEGEGRILISYTSDLSIQSLKWLMPLVVSTCERRALTRRLFAGGLVTIIANVLVWKRVSSAQ